MRNTPTQNRSAGVSGCHGDSRPSTTGVRVCVRSREMENLDRFLRVTAEKESEAKFRLQVVFVLVRFVPEVPG